MLAGKVPAFRYVATLPSVATHPTVASVAIVAIHPEFGRAVRRSVATVATREFAVATTKPLIGKASGHTNHSGHSCRTDPGIPLGFELCGWDISGPRGRASILSLRSGKCGQCGHWPGFSSTYQWPHEIAVWPLWPLGMTDDSRARHLRLDRKCPPYASARPRSTACRTNRQHCGRRRPAPPRTEPSPP